MNYYNQQQPLVVVPPLQGYPPEGCLMYAYHLPGYPPQGYTPVGYPLQGYPQGYLLRQCYFIQNNIFVYPQAYPPQGYPPQYPAPQQHQQRPQQHQQRRRRWFGDGFAKGWRTLGGRKLW